MATDHNRPPPESYTIAIKCVLCMQCTALCVCVFVCARGFDTCRVACVMWHVQNTECRPRTYSITMYFSPIIQIVYSVFCTSCFRFLRHDKKTSGETRQVSIFFSILLSAMFYVSPEFLVLKCNYEWTDSASHFQIIKQLLSSHHKQYSNHLDWNADLKVAHVCMLIYVNTNRLGSDLEWEKSKIQDIIRKSEIVGQNIFLSIS